MNYRLILLFSLIFLELNLTTQAQNESETRNYIKTIPVGRETILEVSNKYGTVQITPWSKDSAYIRAEVKAYGKDQSKLSKMFAGIKVNITDAKYIVTAQTEFTSNINMFFENFKGMTNKIISYDSRVEINYYISVPDYLRLKVDNKYGDVYVENTSSEITVSISNGSFKANSLGKNSTLNLTFCDAEINSIISGNIDASFSNITIESSDDLTINSVSSKYDIKKAGIIRGESRRDKFFIDDIASLNFTSYFTDFRMGNIKKELVMDSRYGNIRASLIDKGFTSVNIKSGYADITLNFDPASSYNLDIRHINAFLVLPDMNTNIEEKAINEDKKEYLTTGTVGNNPGSSKVKIDATRGNIYFK
jgi:hypothetical protein